MTTIPKSSKFIYKGKLHWLFNLVQWKTTLHVFLRYAMRTKKAKLSAF